MKTINVDEIKIEMQKCIDNWDTEGAHVDADELLCLLLIDLGHQEIVDMYQKVKKWYA